jgi:ABC-type bacteriocin/lantibiotic exporter with double-glycine peptidase domain
MIDEATRGHAEISLQKAETGYINRFTHIVSVLYRVRSRLFLITNGVSIRLFETIAVLGLFLLVLSVLFWVEPTDVLPLLTLYVAAAFRILPSLNRIATATSQLTSHQYLLGLVRSGEIQKSETVGRDLPPPQTIKLDGLAFKYPESTNYVFERLNAGLLPGGMIGISGKSGSGKTTLAKILCGLIEPDSGSIQWNEQILDSSTSLQQSVYLLPQEPFVFKDTVAANVTFRKEVNPEKLNQCLKQAHLFDWIDGLPMKHNTLVADKGATLSGGQKQRLSIARALYFGASVLVVDEPTNSLDEEARQTVLQTLKELSRSIIVVLISHHEDELKHCKTVISL